MPTGPAPPPDADLAQRFRGRYPGVPLSVGVIRGEVAAIASECGLEGEALGDCVLGVSEAASNAVIHGSVGREDAHIDLVVGVSDGVMLVTVCDNGLGLQPSRDAGGLGAGLAIIAAVTCRLDLRSSADGIEVHMAFLRPGEPPDDDIREFEAAANRERARAHQRLDGALVEQDRLGELLDGATGSSSELTAYVRLREAGEQVAAREVWLNWVETGRANSASAPATRSSPQVRFALRQASP